MTFAIAYAEQPEKVVLWCEDEGRDVRGRKFSVINGAWSGAISDDGQVYVNCYPNSKLPRGKIVWEGYAPGRDYNEAIAWIERAMVSGEVAEPNPVVAMLDEEDEVPF